MFSFDKCALLNLDYDSYGLTEFDQSVVKDMIEELLPSSFEDIEKVVKAGSNINLISLYIVEHSITLSVEDAKEFLFMVDSFGRPEILHTLHSKIDKIEWLHLFRDFWTSCDSCSLYHEEFRSILKSYNIRTIRRHIHTDEDKIFYKSLPEEFEVYRGTFSDERFRHGISWTTDYDIADRFERGYRNFAEGGPMIYRYRSGMRDEIFSLMQNIALQGTEVLHKLVDKSSVFVLTSRGEREVFVL